MKCIQINLNLHSDCKFLTIFLTQIFAPDEFVPNMEQAAEMNKGFSESAERTTTINEYENASVSTKS